MIKKLAREVLIRWYIPVMLSIANFFTISNNFSAYRIKIFFLRLTFIKIHPHVFVDRGFDCFHPANITIGKHCSLGHHNRIWAFGKVTLGDHVQTALGLTIISGGHRTDTYEPLTENQEVVLEGENWIGANVTILGGVRIGRGAVIGAGSVVNKSIPPFTIAVGVPARVVKDRTPGDQVISPFGYYSPVRPS